MDQGDLFKFLQQYYKVMGLFLLMEAMLMFFVVNIFYKYYKINFIFFILINIIIGEGGGGRIYI